MNDLISRQAAIDALHMHLMYRMGTDSNKKRLDEWINNLPSAQPEKTQLSDEDATKDTTCDCINRQEAIDAVMDEFKKIPTNAIRAKTRIKELPPAQPERKKGKWINDEHDMPRCSECGYMPEYNKYIDDYYYSDFCPNCGAEMRGEQDE